MRDARGGELFQACLFSFNSNLNASIIHENRNDLVAESRVIHLRETVLRYEVKE